MIAQRRVDGPMLFSESDLISDGDRISPEKSKPTRHSCSNSEDIRREFAARTAESGGSLCSHPCLPHNSRLLSVHPPTRIPHLPAHRSAILRGQLAAVPVRQTVRRSLVRSVAASRQKSPSSAIASHDVASSALIRLSFAGNCRRGSANRCSKSKLPRNKPERKHVQASPACQRRVGFNLNSSAFPTRRVGRVFEAHQHCLWWASKTRPHPTIHSILIIRWQRHFFAGPQSQQSEQCNQRCQSWQRPYPCRRNQ